MQRLYPVLLVAAFVGVLAGIGAAFYYATDTQPKAHGLLPAPGSTRTVPGCSGLVLNTPWERKILLDDYVGTDGIAAGDIDGDGDLDIVSPFEQALKTALLINPGPASVWSGGEWAHVVVESGTDVEGACIGDLDNDGRPDVATAEQNGGAVKISFRPDNVADIMTTANWTVITLSNTPTDQANFDCAVADIDGDGEKDLVVAGGDGPGAGANGQLYWMEQPAASKRTGSNWVLHTITSPVDLIMAVESRDVDGDTDFDVIASDRTGANAGTYVMFNSSAGTVWTKQNIATLILGVTSVMIFGVGDLDLDGDLDVVNAADGLGANGVVRTFTNIGGGWTTWVPTLIPTPSNVGGFTAGRIGDINLDGRPDLVISYYDATGSQDGLVYQLASGDGSLAPWRRGLIDDQSVGGNAKRKFDDSEVIDLDGDGDLDVISGDQGDESTQWLGVAAYRNPCK